MKHKPVCVTAATAPTTTSEPTPWTSPPTNPTVPELTFGGANKGSESPDVSEAGEDNELELDDEDADWGCDDNENGEVLRAAREQASGDVMNMQCNDGVNVSVPQLLDYLSDTPLHGLLVPDSAPTGVKKWAANGAAPKVFEVSDIQFWIFDYIITLFTSYITLWFHSITWVCLKHPVLEMCGKVWLTFLLYPRWNVPISGLQVRHFSKKVWIR